MTLQRWTWTVLLLLAPSLAGAAAPAPTPEVEQRDELDRAMRPGPFLLVSNPYDIENGLRFEFVTSSQQPAMRVVFAKKGKKKERKEYVPPLWLAGKPNAATWSWCGYCSIVGRTRVWPTAKA